MVKPFVVPLAIVFLVSCEQGKDRPALTNNTTHVDSTSLPIEPRTESSTRTDSIDIIEESIRIPADSSPYIGEVDAFEETGEYYTSIYYLPHVPESGAYEFLSDRTDSVVYEGDEMRRKRVPMALAEMYFNLEGLLRVSVFTKGKLVSQARLVRVELLEGIIESQFIAVFKPEDVSTFSSGVSYCISSGDIPAKNIDLTWQALVDSALTQEILRDFEMDSNPWNAVHIKTLPDDVTYSGITFQSRSFLIETRRGESTIVKTIDKDYYIGSILPLHLAINGKPVLLLRMGVNETDMVWTSLAVFSGDKYEFLEGNRLKGKVYL